MTDTVRNQGVLPTVTNSTTRYYLSADAVRNMGDKLLTGVRTVPPLSPGAVSSGSATVTVPNNTALGTYYLLACADDTTNAKDENRVYLWFRFREPGCNSSV